MISATTALSEGKAADPLRAAIVLVLGLVIIGGAAALLAQGSASFLTMFGLGLAGGEAQGAAYAARTHGSYETGTMNAQGTGYAANIGLFGRSYAVAYPPLIRQATMVSHLVANGSPALLFISAAYATNTSANITLPDNTTQEVALANGQNTSFASTAQIGRYLVTFVAQGSEGVATANDYFDVAPGTLFNLTVIDSSSQGVPASIVVRHDGEEIASNSSDSGNFSLLVPATVGSVEVTAYNGSFAIILNSVNLTVEAQFGIDRHNVIPGFLVTYGTDSSLPFANATVTTSYLGLPYTDENRLHLYTCEQYDFTDRTCGGSWDDVTAAATRNTTARRFQYSTTSLSGFSIKEIPAPTGGTGGGGGGGGGGVWLLELGVTVEKRCEEGAVRFRVTGYQGSPVMASVKITANGSGFSTELLTDPAGMATLPLVDGQYYLSFNKSGYEPQSGFFLMDCGAPTEMNISGPPENESPTQPIGEKSTELPPENAAAGEGEANAPPQEAQGIAGRNETVPGVEQQTSTAGVEGGVGRWLYWTLIVVIVISLAGLIAVRARVRAATRSPTAPPKQETEAERAAEPQPTIAPETGPASLPAATPPPATPEPVRSTWEAEEKQIPSPAALAAFKDLSQPVPKTPVAPARTAQATVDEAYYLRDLDEPSWFLLADGRRMRSIMELVKALPEMGNELFSAHVTPYRNDFATWIYHTIGYHDLAERLGAVKSKTEMHHIILAKVHEILRAAHAHHAHDDVEERLNRIDAALQLYENIGAGGGKAS